MKKILVYVTSEKYTSLFDIIVGYDSGADIVIPYNNVKLEDVEDIVHSSVFTRTPDGLNKTAIFIGGLDIKKAERILMEVQETIKALPEPFTVSIALDPNGAITTASACVLKIISKLKTSKGLNATVLAGTGPVGQSTATLLAKEGCNVTLTSRKKKRAIEVCKNIASRYNVQVNPFAVKDTDTLKEAVSDSKIVVSTGSAGREILPKRIWSDLNIEMMADMNAVPPYGIEGLDPHDDYKSIAGKIGIGALAVGNLKMKIHKEVIKKLFERKDFVFDLEKVYSLGKCIVDH